MPDLYGAYDNKVCTPKVTLRVKNIKIRVIQMLLHVWLITYTVNKVCQILIKKKNKGLSNDLPIPLEATKNHMITFPCLLLILGQHHTWLRGDYNVEIMVPLNLSSSLWILFSGRTKKFI